MLRYFFLLQEKNSCPEKKKSFGMGEMILSQYSDFFFAFAIILVGDRMVNCYEVEYLFQTNP